MEMIRAFIAITPPAEFWPKLDEVKAAFQPQGRSWRWLPSANVHLTLKFLGEIPEAMLARLGSALQQVAAGQDAFPLMMQGLGCFPQVSRPRVLWIGLGDPKNVLGRLHARLEAALTPLGLTPDQRWFRPHMTLARARRTIDTQQLKRLLQAYDQTDFGCMTVCQLHLFRSRLGPQGARYTIVQSLPLRS